MHVHPAAPGFVELSGMWLVMMTLMMAPTVWPWVRAFHSFGAQAGTVTARIIATATFLGGYVTAWLLYAVAAAGFQLQVTVTSYVGAALLVAAGLYQLAPLKRACLTHCRSPLGYFLARWRNGPASGFRIGLAHGVFCVGCCWALMATALVVGMTNLVWMGALTVAAFVEQTLPDGDRLRAPIGLALIAAGVVTVFR